MAIGFFSKPKTVDDWFRVPAAIGVLLAGALGFVALLLGLPAAVAIAFTGGGFDLMICLIALTVFPAPAWLAFKALTRGNMRKAFCWSLVPLVFIGVVWAALGGA